jgi:hypothetical protein
MIISDNFQDFYGGINTPHLTNNNIVELYEVVKLSLLKENKRRTNVIKSDRKKRQKFKFRHKKWVCTELEKPQPIEAPI